MSGGRKEGRKEGKKVQLSQLEHFFTRGQVFWFVDVAATYRRCWDRLKSDTRVLHTKLESWKVASMDYKDLAAYCMKTTLGESSCITTVLCRLDFAHQRG
jgi:hypothetical protein